MLARDEAIPRATESVLLAAFSGDEKAKAVVAEIEKAREARQKLVTAENEKCAGKLGLTMEQVQEMVGKLVEDSHLQSWLQSRINWTHCHGRPLNHDE